MRSFLIGTSPAFSDRVGVVVDVELVLVVLTAGVFFTEDGVEGVVALVGVGRDGEGRLVVFLFDWGVLRFTTDAGPFLRLAGVLSSPSEESSLASSETFFFLELGVMMFLFLVLLGGTYSSSESSEGLYPGGILLASSSSSSSSTRDLFSVLRALVDLRVALLVRSVVFGIASESKVLPLSGIFSKWLT